MQNMTILEFVLITIYMIVGTWHTTDYLDKQWRNGHIQSGFKHEPLRTIWLIVFWIFFTMYLWPMYRFFKWAWRGE